MSNILGADPVYGRTQEDAVIIDRRLFAETLPPSSADEDDDNADPDGEEYRDAIRRSTAMVLDDSNEFSSPPTSSQIDRLDSPTENTRNPWMSSLVDSAFDRNHPHSMLRSTMLMHDMLRTLIEHTRRLSVRMMNKHRLGDCIPSLVLKQIMPPMRWWYNHRPLVCVFQYRNFPRFKSSVAHFVLPITLPTQKTHRTILNHPFLVIHPPIIAKDGGALDITPSSQIF